jgi:galactokinase
MSALTDTQASAPGRVNLIGEHTDYNGGYVLPAAIPHETVVRLVPRNDRLVNARSLDIQSDAATTFEVGHENVRRSWIDYVQGVTWALAERQAEITGFDLVVSSTVPIGKGLSSSASLEVATARALNDAFELGLTGTEIALLCYRAETAFVGAPVGVMDHMACSLGDRTHALFLDTASLCFEHVPLPGNLELGIVDSGISHAHAGGEYGTRRRECDEAARRLGVKWLRAITPDDLAGLAKLPDPLNRRVRHVATENARVLAAVRALQQSDLPALGALFLESHTSMRDDFEISTPEIDRLVDIATHEPGVFGARMTGGGFGGAVVIACAAGTAEFVTKRTAEKYTAELSIVARALLP